MIAQVKCNTRDCTSKYKYKNMEDLMSNQINLTLGCVKNKNPHTIAKSIVDQFQDKGLGIDVNEASIHLTGEAKVYVDSLPGYKNHDQFCNDILWHLKNLLKE